jgi:predicted nuclease of restriction endonuclease-like (RecB) superfamily
MSLPLPTDKTYQQWLEALKAQIQQAQFRTAVRVNSELILLYWQIGKSILDKQETLGWGAKVVDRLAKDLQKAFPTIKGFSLRNLKYMRAFADAYPDEAIVQQAAAQIPWFHNCILLDKVKDPKARVWYIQQTLKNGWSRNVLAMQIDSGLYKRQGAALTNFEQTLPALQSDLARQLLKDPYSFDFLGLGDEAQEREVEQALLLHIRDFLLELGVGFAFVGSQYHLEIGGDDFYIDLLFYHLQLRCYVVIDLKTGKFKPDYAGQMNFYLSALDDVLKHPNDSPSIGLILCRDKNDLVVEYSLRGQNKPMGVSEYQLTQALPESFKGKLPTVEELERELGDKK